MPEFCAPLLRKLASRMLLLTPKRGGGALHVVSSLGLIVW